MPAVWLHPQDLFWLFPPLYLHRRLKIGYLDEELVSSVENVDRFHLEGIVSGDKILEEGDSDAEGSGDDASTRPITVE